MAYVKIFHGKNLRCGRVSERGRPYLVTTVTRQRQPVFSDFHIGRLLVGVLKDVTGNHYAATLAWVVMPDHLHWLLVVGDEPLDAVVRRVKSRSAIAINRMTNATGPIWQQGYHEHALRKEEDLAATARYIVANPLRAGIVARIGDYPLWDSIYL